MLVVEPELVVEQACDMSPVLPGQIRDSEQQLASLPADLGRVLLERGMIRRELRLRGMQERLRDQQEEITALQARLAELESLPGLALLQYLSTSAGAARNQASTLITTIYKVKLNSPREVQRLCCRLFYHGFGFITGTIAECRGTFINSFRYQTESYLYFIA